MSKWTFKSDSAGHGAQKRKTKRIKKKRVKRDIWR